MAKIPLTNGGYTLVDDEDYDFLTQWRWQNNGGYARRSTYVKNEKLPDGTHRSINRQIQMHRVINNTPDGFVTDHINGDKLDNRRFNLRTATHSQNSLNRHLDRPLVGAQWRKDRNKWRSYICVKGKDIYLGSYNTEIAAHRAYMSARKMYSGL